MAIVRPWSVYLLPESLFSDASINLKWQSRGACDEMACLFRPGYLRTG